MANIYAEWKTYTPPMIIIIYIKGLDRTKDQSYFLFATTPKQLKVIRFALDNASARILAYEYYAQHYLD